MKKYKILLCTILLILTVSTFNVVKAGYVQINYIEDVNYYDYWDYGVSGGHTYFELEYPLGDYNMFSFEKLSIDIGKSTENSFNNVNPAGIPSYLELLDISGDRLYYVALEDIYTSTACNNFISINYETGIISTEEGSIDSGLDPIVYVYNSLYKIDTIRLVVFQDSGFSQTTDDWIQNTNIYIFTNDVVVNFYAFYESEYQYLYDVQIIEYNDIPVQPTDPEDTPTENSVFIGWQKEDGTLYDFTNAFTTEELESGYINLTAAYINYNFIVDDTPTVSPDVSTGLGNILDIAGMNNYTGYIIFFVILQIIMIILSLILKLDFNIIIIESLILFTIFIFTGMLSVTAIIILSLLYTILLVGKIINDSGGNGSE